MRFFCLVFVWFKVFGTSLPQEGGTKTGMKNQQIATQMSVLAFCQFDMTHTNNILINKLWKEFNILSIPRPMTHTVKTLKSTVV